MSQNSIDVITRFPEAQGDQETSFDGDFQSVIPGNNSSVDERSEEDGFPQGGNELPQEPLYAKTSLASSRSPRQNSEVLQEPVTFYDFMSAPEPFPGFVPVSLLCLRQTTPIRRICLRMILSSWFERISMAVILLNCVTLALYQPCDGVCDTSGCHILSIIDHVIFAFFTVEMLIKMIAMGIYGKKTYLADSWNRLDCFIVTSGLLEYAMNMDNINLTAIRTIRVLRPLRAINRVPSMRILVMLLLDTLPMLGSTFLLAFFVFFSFGIVGVQLWVRNIYSCQG
ncbi:hypothetical protein RvY_05292-2 [Ramazzottius varieornatus]|uniref:Ion transport domain-containing protein n=1 Tax=Ramazzottius varieornatus TaxID=947166 RepID=A0A1D1V184_RAMVA|nr:hypothetical protein RvY_05292-2 [Ramazzottius varieornatus]